eukprot:306833-Chlamydomonas_euryale.AAC.6
MRRPNQVRPLACAAAHHESPATLFPVSAPCRAVYRTQWGCGKLQDVTWGLPCRGIACDHKPSDERLGVAGTAASPTVLHERARGSPLQASVMCG